MNSKSHTFRNIATLKESFPIQNGFVEGNRIIGSISKVIRNINNFISFFNFLEKHKIRNKYLEYIVFIFNIYDGLASS